MKVRSTVEALQHEEAVILAWIGEITSEKQARLYVIRRRLQRIAWAERQKQRNAGSVQTSPKKGVGAKTGK